MKRSLLLFIAIGFIVSAMAQYKPYSNTANSKVKVPKTTFQIDDQVVGAKATNTTVISDAILADEIVMQTVYDLQSNAAMQHRIYRYDDGSIGAVSMMAHLDDFTDRGTGYNYYDGTSWAAQPAARIENTKTGWPSYAPLGANGEIVVAHRSGTTPLVLSKRDTRGTGVWTQLEIPSPAASPGMLWPRMVTNGPDHMNVHVICLTAPTGNGGVVYEGMDGAVVYNRSLDGGETWDGWQLLDGMTSAEYLGFGGDSYAWAEPHGNTLAFMLGDNWNDAFVMKSMDNGDSWTKEMIWNCPFNLWAGGDTTGDFNCMDGVMALAIGPDDVVHTTIGFMRANGDETGAKFYFPWTDGLIYWNDNMPEFPQELDPEWLDENGYMIGWVQDTMVWYGDVTQLAYYYNSMSGIPSVVVDDANQVFAFWSGVTELLDINNYFLRHIYARASVDGGDTWRDYIHYVSSDFLYQWSEIVYVSTSPTTSAEKIYFSFQEDGEAGTYLKGSQGAQGQVSITNNNITFSDVAKADIINWGVGVNNQKAESFAVAQNYPNPVNGNTAINVHLTQPGNLSLAVTNVVGQQVMQLTKGAVNAGSYQFIVDGSGLSAGVYFYTVTVNNQSVTKRMIVE
ncbi:MAG: T9SS type A sorting domain-containing protein [Bacteroidales bacterium]|nr:T9SS type A sorting domain-containing protein [Bacteroidales bacterium]